MYTEEHEPIGYKRHKYKDKVLRYRNEIKGQTYPILIHQLVRDLNKGLAPVLIIVGDMGKGKTALAQRVHEILYDEIEAFDGDFDPGKHLLYDPKNFLEQIQDVDYNQDQSVNQNREAFIFDEAGAKLNSKDWRSAENRAVDIVIQTQRMRNCLYIITLPDVNNLDKNVVRMADYIAYKTGRKTALTGKIKSHNAWIGSNNIRAKLKIKWKNIQLPSDKYMEDYRPKENEEKENLLEEQRKSIIEDRKEEDDGMDASELFS